MALESLQCGGNQLTTLDLSKNMVLYWLECENNQLTTLDVSKVMELKHLYCYGNRLTTLDLSKNAALWIMECQDNLLTALDMAKNTKLMFLKCYGNQIKDAGMDELVESLPMVSHGALDVMFIKDEGNVMTTNQVAAAKAKGWNPYYFDGKDWKEYVGSNK
jgi:hypothetical protein